MRHDDLVMVCEASGISVIDILDVLNYLFILNYHNHDNGQCETLERVAAAYQSILSDYYGGISTRAIYSRARSYQSILSDYYGGIRTRAIYSRARSRENSRENRLRKNATIEYVYPDVLLRDLFIPRELLITYQLLTICIFVF